MCDLHRLCRSPILVNKPIRSFAKRSGCKRYCVRILFRGTLKKKLVWTSFGWPLPMGKVTKRCLKSGWARLCVTKSEKQLAMHLLAIHVNCTLCSDSCMSGCSSYRQVNSLPTAQLQQNTVSFLMPQSVSTVCCSRLKSAGQSRRSKD